MTAPFVGGKGVGGAGSGRGAEVQEKCHFRRVIEWRCGVGCVFVLCCEVCVCSAQFTAVFSKYVHLAN